MFIARGMPTRVRRSFSSTAGPLRLKGRVVSTRRMPRKPFLMMMSFTGAPSAGIGAGDALLDVVDLGLHGREVVLRAPLEDVARAERGEPRDLHDVLPDVLREHLGEPGEQLLLREALLLEVHAIGVEEDGAAVAEL